MGPGKYPTSYNPTDTTGLLQLNCKLLAGSSKNLRLREMVKCNTDSVWD